MHSVIYNFCSLEKKIYSFKNNWSGMGAQMWLGGKRKENLVCQHPDLDQPRFCYLYAVKKVSIYATGTSISIVQIS